MNDAEDVIVGSNQMPRIFAYCAAVATGCKVISLTHADSQEKTFMVSTSTKPERIAFARTPNRPLALSKGLDS